MLILLLRFCQRWRKLAQDNLALTLFSFHFSHALCWELKSNFALMQSGAWRRSPRDSHSRAQANQINRVASQNLKQRQTLQPVTQQLQASTGSEASYDDSYLEIKHRQQRRQQVSWTTRIRKTLYLRKLHHTACSPAVGSSKACRVVRARCFLPDDVNWKMVLCNYRDWALNQIRAAVDVMYGFGRRSNTIERPSNQTF